MVWAVETFDAYVGAQKPVTVITDHNALCGLLKMKNPTDQPARWVLRLRPYKMEVTYRRGTLTSMADHLSRYPLDNGIAPINLMLCAALIPLLTIDIVSAQRNDPFCSNLLKILEGPSNSPIYRSRILTYGMKDRVLSRMVHRPGKVLFLLLVPKTIRKTILEAIHDRSGHQGMTRTYALMHEQIFLAGCD